jgi:hypothetical protein
MLGSALVARVFINDKFLKSVSLQKKSVARIELKHVL